MQLRIAEDHDYTRDSVRTSGARVTILPFNGPPNVLEDGFDVPISFETNLELSAVSKWFNKQEQINLTRFEECHENLLCTLLL
jgi:hypothetical protein